MSILFCPHELLQHFLQNRFLFFGLLQLSLQNAFGTLSTIIFIARNALQMFRCRRVSPLHSLCLSLRVGGVSFSTYAAICVRKICLLIAKMCSTILSSLVPRRRVVQTNFNPAQWARHCDVASRLRSSVPLRFVTFPSASARSFHRFSWRCPPPPPPEHES